MSLVKSNSIELITQLLTPNTNLLSPTGFRLTLSRTPNIEYFCQSASIPDITLGIVEQSTPIGQPITRAGGRIDFSALTLRFLIDENLTNYLEIFNWIVELGKSSSTNQYRQNKNQTDAILHILSSNSNPNIEISFRNIIPTSLSALEFDVKSNSVEYLEASVRFIYTYFEISVN